MLVIIGTFDLWMYTYSHHFNLFFTGQLEVTGANVVEILAASELLRLTHASQKCCEFMLDNIDQSNSMDLLGLAERFNLTVLRKRTWDYSLRYFDDIVNAQGFLTISVSSFISLLSSDDLCAKSEETVYDAILQWLQVDDFGRMIHAVSLFECVRFYEIDPNVITQKILKSSLFCDSVSNHPLYSVVQLAAAQSTKRIRSRGSISILVLGGMIESNTIASSPHVVEKYDVNQDLWSKFESNYFQVRRHAAASMISQDGVVVVGGIVEHEVDRVPVSYVEILNLSTKSWREAQPIAMSLTGLRAAQLFGRVYITG